MRISHEVVGSVVVNLVEPFDRRHKRTPAGGDDDIAAANRSAVYFDRPRRGDARLSLHHVDSESAVALDRIMRLDVTNHLLDTLHDFGKIELGAGTVNTEFALRATCDSSLAERRIAFDGTQP